jgi:hypothetical protein
VLLKNDLLEIVFDFRNIGGNTTPQTPAATRSPAPNLSLETTEFIL